MLCLVAGMLVIIDTLNHQVSAENRKVQTTVTEQMNEKSIRTRVTTMNESQNRDDKSAGTVATASKYFLLKVNGDGYPGLQLVPRAIGTPACSQHQITRLVLAPSFQIEA